MKNCFYVHSHITYFLTKAIIAKMKIPDNEVFLLLSRNYSNPEIHSFKSIDLSFYHDKLNTYSVFNSIIKQSLIPEIDGLIENLLLKSIYSVYLPHVFHPVMQIIATHHNCHQINIIEEGVNSYSEYLLSSKDRSYLKGFVKRIINGIKPITRNRIYFIKSFDLTKFKKPLEPIFYSITSKAFPGVEHKVIRLKMIPLDDLVYDLSGSISLILEGAVDQGNMKEETLLDGIKKILNDIDSQLLYVKFHPAQKIESRDKILKLIFESGITAKIIPDEIPFEQVFLTSKNLKVYGFTSSLLFYAHEYNCKVFSYEEKLMYDPIFKLFRSKNNFDLTKLLNE